MRLMLRSVLPLVLVAVLAGCAGSTTPGAAGDGQDGPRPAAEVVDAPDCAVREAFDGLGGGERIDDLPAAPAAGAVPSGFAPVAVVQCAPDIRVVEMEPRTLPPSGTPDADPAPTPAEPELSVVVVRRAGDLDPLLAVLALPDVEAEADQACIAMYEMKPLVYLVDADDRAVRVAWPTDGCGFVRDRGLEVLDALPEVSRTQQRLG